MRVFQPKMRRQRSAGAQTDLSARIAAARGAWRRAGSEARWHGLARFILAACLCFAPLGCRSKAAKSAAPALPLFHDTAEQANVLFRWGHGRASRLTILDTIGHGCAFLDYDNDGKLDILLIGERQCRLFHNLGGGKFEDVTAAAFPDAPVLAPGQRLLGCAIADYDGDGYPDIFVSGYGRAILYHNESRNQIASGLTGARTGRRFRDVTRGSGLEARSSSDWMTSAAWADIDGDGRLDLYVCRYVQFTPLTPQTCSFESQNGSPLQMACDPNAYDSQRGSLYRGLGGGRFRDITRQAGMADASGNALGAMFCDFNQDGRPDLYVANDQKPGDLFVNRGHGRFENIGIASGVGMDAALKTPSGMGVSWGDYDNDGRFDLLVGTFYMEAKSLYHNDGNETFTNQSYASGLGQAALPPVTFGAAFIDVENRGLLDIVLANGHVLSEIEKAGRQVSNPATYPQSAQLLLNTGGGHFREASGEAGADFTRKIVGRGLAVGDYDNDGRLDILMVDDEGSPLLLHNDAPAGNHWISLRCLSGPRGTDAVGARLRIFAGGRAQIAEVRTGGTYLSTDAPAAHFGLGRATSVETLEVRWPDGHTHIYSHLEADHAYRLQSSDTPPVRLY